MRNGHAKLEESDVALLDAAAPSAELVREMIVEPSAELDEALGLEPPLIGAPPDEIALSARIESLLFVAEAPTTFGELTRALDVTRREVQQGLKRLERDLAKGGRGLRLQREGATVQMVTAPESADDVQRFLGRDRDKVLSRPALEALAIIAYRQPLTRPEIDDLRGVNSDGVLRTLMARGLVEPVGRRETVGHPIEYGTTFHFLEYFGLAALEDLPPIESFPGAVAADEEGVEEDEAVDERTVQEADAEPSGVLADAVSS
jgi:segregation and condensation protein B